LPSNPMALKNGPKRGHRLSDNVDMVARSLPPNLTNAQSRDRKLPR
jgi:hypothetical protein